MSRISNKHHDISTLKLVFCKLSFISFKSRNVFCFVLQRCKVVNQTYVSLRKEIHFVKRVRPRSVGDSLQNLNPSRISVKCKTIRAALNQSAFTLIV